MYKIVIILLLCGCENTPTFNGRYRLTKTTCKILNGPELNCQDFPIKSNLNNIINIYLHREYDRAGKDHRLLVTDMLSDKFMDDYQFPNGEPFVVSYDIDNYIFKIRREGYYVPYDCPSAGRVWLEYEVYMIFSPDHIVVAAHLVSNTGSIAVWCPYTQYEPVSYSMRLVYTRETWQGGSLTKEPGDLKYANSNYYKPFSLFKIEDIL